MMSREYDYRQHNRTAWNALAKERNRFAQPAKDADFENPLKSVDGPGWLGPSIEGESVLCLAAGGGRQAPLYAAAGANVTVVDISDDMLAIDRQVCKLKGLSINTVQASMDDLSMLADSTFSTVIHPVSTCYVPDLELVYSEVARVIKPDGLYISQHKQPTSLQVSIDPNSQGRYEFLHEYCQLQPLPASSRNNLVREHGTCEYLHSWQSLIGMMCRCGFVIEALIEPRHGDANAQPGTFEHRSRYVSPYVRMKARRIEGTSPNPNTIWTPS